jgi:hypothetical protein
MAKKVLLSHFHVPCSLFHCSIVLLFPWIFAFLVFFFDLVEEVFHFENIIQRIIVKEAELRHQAQLCFDTGIEFALDFPGTVGNFFQGGFWIGYLEKAEVNARLEQVGRDFDGRNGHHSAIDHAQPQATDDIVHFCLDKPGYLFLAFTFFHF